MTHFFNTPKSIAILLVVASALSLPAQAENFERGLELFQHHCHSCHGDLKQRNKKSKVKTLSELRTRVEAWSAHSGNEWGVNEIDDVMFYLNKSFYHFKESVD